MNNMRILRHTLGWCMWFTVTCSFSFLWFLIYDYPIPIIPTLYSFVSLILIYYASYYASHRFFEKHITADSSAKIAVLQYLFSWRVIWPVIIAGSYFAISWLTDQWFASIKLIPEQHSEPLLYLDARFSRACFYLAVPMYFAADDCLLARKDKIIAGESSVSQALMKEMDEKHDHYERRLKEMEGQLARLEINTRKNG
jgi:hypothetical protein